MNVYVSQLSLTEGEVIQAQPQILITNVPDRLSFSVLVALFSGNGLNHLFGEQDGEPWQTHGIDPVQSWTDNKEENGCKMLPPDISKKYDWAELVTLMKLNKTKFIDYP